MKVKTECAHCGKQARKVTVTVDPVERDRFLNFVERMQQTGKPGIIPPTKYPKQPALMPALGENPCQHCKYGEDLVGPSGCGRGNTCLPYQYFQMNNLDTSTNQDTLTTLKDFTCGAKNAAWLFPTKKKAIARSVGLALPYVPVTSSAGVATASSKKRVRHSSKWRNSSSKRSSRKSKRSLKRA